MQVGANVNESFFSYIGAGVLASFPSSASSSLISYEVPCNLPLLTIELDMPLRGLDSECELDSGGKAVCIE